MNNLTDYIFEISKQSKCCFTIEEAQKNMGKTVQAIRLAIARLLAKGKIAKPAKEFYVIVPPEYSDQECIPAEQFIPYLMEFWGYKYYVGMLSAASYYGASHQAAQVYQVVIDKKRPQYLKCGKVTIQFIIKSDIEKTCIQKFSTPKSYLNISSPEETAFDLITYPKQSGGLSHIATVLAELQESIKPNDFAKVIASKSENPSKQRLGYILEQIGAEELAEVIKRDLDSREHVKYVPLIRGMPTDNMPRNKKWMLIENTTIESDI